MRMSTLGWESFKAQRVCANKRRFGTKAECLVSIARAKAEVPLYAYKCPLCGFWHKTKNDPAGNVYRAGPKPTAGF